MNSKQDNDQQQDLTEFGGGSAETGTDESNSESTAGVESFSPELFEDPDGAFAPDETETDDQAALNEVFKEYLSEIDGKLVEAGWLFLPNKEYRIQESRPVDAQPHAESRILPSSLGNAGRNSRTTTNLTERTA